MARMQPATARLNGSVGDSLLVGGGFELEVIVRLFVTNCGGSFFRVLAELIFHDMADPENQTLRVLRDIRGAIESMDQRLGGLSDKVDKNQEDLRSRLDSLRQAINGESVLGRYAAAEVEERLESLEKRIAALESRR